MLAGLRENPVPKDDSLTDCCIRRIRMGCSPASDQMGASTNVKQKSLTGGRRTRRTPPPVVFGKLSPLAELAFIGFWRTAPDRLPSMHRDLCVSNAGWITSGASLHALNYWHVVPGEVTATGHPTWAGSCTRTWGGIRRGTLFLLRGTVAFMILLSWLLHRISATRRLVAGLFYGIKPPSQRSRAGRASHRARGRQEAAC